MFMILEMDLTRPPAVSALYRETAVVITKENKLLVKDVIRQFSSEAAKRAFPHKNGISLNRYFVDRFRKGLVTTQCKIVQTNRDGICYHIELDQVGGLSSTVIRIDVSEGTVSDSLEFSPYDDCFINMRRGFVGNGIHLASQELRDRGMRMALRVPSLNEEDDIETYFWVKDR
jgi:hypothetical protein